MNKIRIAQTGFIIATTLATAGFGQNCFAKSIEHKTETFIENLKDQEAALKNKIKDQIADSEEKVKKKTKEIPYKPYKR